jgi:dTDP-4-dehydrorhamnose reductase
MRALGPNASVVAPLRNEIDLDRLDEIVHRVMAIEPRLIINAAGYTAVDRAQSDQDACLRANAEAPMHLAEAARACDALIVHYSTDYVFDGLKSVPYVEADAVNPLSVYGRSKLAGERAVMDSGARHLIVRTSWVYGPHGNNFLRTIRRLARERSELRVVNDQTGAPTSSRSVAMATIKILSQIEEQTGRDANIYHIAARGETTWYKFALEILESDPRRAEHVCERVVPISTSEYAAPAPRPRYSVLNSTAAETRFGLMMPAWRDDLATVIAELDTE